MPLLVTEALMTIATPDLEQSVTFYQHLLGQEPAQMLPAVYAEFQLPGLRLGLFRPKSTESTPAPLHRDRAPTNGMALCLEVTDLEQAIAQITALGYPPTSAIAIASHGREVYATDPDGNPLILHQRHPVSSV